MTKKQREAFSTKLRRAFLKSERERDAAYASKLHSNVKAPAKKNPSGTAVTVKSVGTNHNVYVGSTRVGSFPDKAEAVRYGKHLIKTRRLMSKRAK